MNNLREKIEKVLKEIINPRIAMHSGLVELVDVDEDNGVATVRFAGLCIDCPMADMTFEGLVEAELMSEIPELKGVTLNNSQHDL